MVSIWFCQLEKVKVFSGILVLCSTPLYLNTTTPNKIFFFFFFFFAKKKKKVFFLQKKKIKKWKKKKKKKKCKSIFSAKKYIYIYKIYLKKKKRKKKIKKLFCITRWARCSYLCPWGPWQPPAPCRCTRRAHSCPSQRPQRDTPGKTGLEWPLRYGPACRGHFRWWPEHKSWHPPGCGTLQWKKWGYFHAKAVMQKKRYLITYFI